MLLSPAMPNMMSCHARQVNPAEEAHEGECGDWSLSVLAASQNKGDTEADDRQAACSADEPETAGRLGEP